MICDATPCVLSRLELISQCLPPWTVRVLHRLRQRVAHLGFSLLNRETGELLEGAVS
jgi:hypothetical protein